MLLSPSKQILYEQSKKSVNVSGINFAIAISLFSFFAFALAHYMVESAYYVRVMQGVGVFSIFFVLHKLRNIELVLILGGLLLSILFLINLIAFNQLYFTGFYPLALVPIAICIYRFSLCKPNAVSLCFSVYVLIFSLIVLIQINIFNIPSNEILTQSRNHIATIGFSSFVIALLAAKMAFKKRITWITLIVSGLLVSFIMMMYSGRTGLVLGGIVLCLIFIETQRLNKSAGFISLLAGGIILFNLFSGYLAAPDAHLTALNRILDRGLDSPRWEIWKSVILYIYDMFTLSHIFGYEYSLSRDLTGFSTHNSFIELYRCYGLIGLILCVFFLVTVFLKAARIDLILSLIFFGLLIRSFLDATLLGPYVGVAVIFACLIIVDRINRHRISLG